MDGKHYNELIDLSQKIYEAAQNAVGLYMKRAEDGTLRTDVHGADEPVEAHVGEEG